MRMRLAKAVGISALALLGAFVMMPESKAQQPPSDANIGATFWLQIRLT